MAATSSGGTVGSGTPWTARQFSDWKRREKGRLTRFHTALTKAPSSRTLSYAALEKQIGVAETEVSTRIERIAELKNMERNPVVPYMLTEEKALRQQVAELDHKISTVFFAGGYRKQRDQASATLRQVKRRHAKEKSAVATQAGMSKRSEEALLRQAKLDLLPLRWVLKSAQDLGFAKSQGTLGYVVDERSVDLDRDEPPPWVLEAVTAYAKEQAAATRKALKKAPETRKQLEKDSKELADLQRSESARLKRVEALERRLAREKDRVLAERQFIYKKLWKKASATPGLTEREGSFLKIDFGTGRKRPTTWASDPKHRNWATKGVEFSAKLRTSARKIKELETDIKEVKRDSKRIGALKSSIRELEKDIAIAGKAGAAADGWPKGPAPRIGYIENAHAFEKYMAEWMGWLGWDDAKAMPVGPDEGIDVKAKGALGQAKHWDTEVGIEEVQRHNGVCEGIQKHGRVFLSKSGYTPQAIKWANDRDLPLFEMKAGSNDAGVVASTKAAEKLLKVGAKAMKGNKRN